MNYRRCVDDTAATDLPAIALPTISLSFAEPRPAAASGWRKVVSEANRLLAGTCAALGGEEGRDVLLSGLDAVLALSGREAALPVAHLLDQPDTRGDLARQARRIGTAIVAAAEEDALNRVQPALPLASSCEGHVWTPEAAALLMGSRGGSVAMQLYNEWLHQLILLRDALLPFANWAEVPLPLAADGGVGLRAIEPARHLLLSNLLMGRPEHLMIVNLARASQGLIRRAASAYGFQGTTGVVLPAFLMDGREPTLLAWHPATMLTEATNLIYEESTETQRRTIDSGSDHAVPAGTASAVELIPTPVGPGQMHMRLHATVDCERTSVDLGHIAKAVRYAARNGDGSVNDPRPTEPAVWHRAVDLLTRAPLAPAVSGVHLVAADPFVALMVAGVVPNTNIVFGDGAPIEVLRCRGKGFGALFVIGSIGA